jgi:DNA-binding protein H-NS
MAKKTLEQIEAQIARLNQAAQDLRKREAASVIKAIKAQIAQYGLNAEDLGLAGASTRATRRQRVKATTAAAEQVQSTARKKGAAKKSTKGSKAAAPAKVAKAKGEKRAASNGSATPHATSKPGEIKFADKQGHTWTGRGKRPGWYLAALESGLTADDLLVKA